jgi:predicted signal transduction protein with EAL and GGDEF domain
LEEELRGATLTAQRIVRQFERPWSLSGYVSVSVSIGVAARTDDEGLDELLRQADTAMYAAKASGKGRWRVFSPDLGTGELTTRSFRAELQHAVEAEEFVVHYQPVMDIASGFITGVEALVRWNHPEGASLRRPSSWGRRKCLGAWSTSTVGSCARRAVRFGPGSGASPERSISPST